MLPLLATETNFNSIKVQLKLTNLIPQTYALEIFQFHKGTIKTIATETRLSKIMHFNSIKVQLKQTTSNTKNIVQYLISIP